MLKLLIRKQFYEIFRSFFYDEKKKRARSKGSTVLWILLFVLLVGGMLGGMFTALSVSFCGGLLEEELGWLYFLVMGLVSLFLGVFGSVFNTYSSLYLAKDNDLLLSMPIPVRAILISRLLSVFLLGALYSGAAILPAVIVYWCTAPFTAKALLGGLAMIAVIWCVVAALSCALGWAVAKLSLRLKNKSYITVLLSLLFLGGYYFVYFKATDLIRSLLEHAAEYGAKIRGAAYGLYLFGRVGEGDPLAVLLFLAGAAALCFAVWAVLSRSFLKIATATGSTEKKAYRERAGKRGSVSGALFQKELLRFTSNANYMLNCGLGVILLLGAGIALLFKGGDLAAIFGAALPTRAGALPVLFSAAVCLIVSMNEMTAPSVSLEGKTIWLAQALPVSARAVLLAKLRMQWALTLPPLCVCLLCAALRLDVPAAEMALAAAATVGYALFSAAFGLFLGLKMPILEWTNETVPIKQSMPVMISTFGGMGIALVMGGGYLLLGEFVPPAVYLAVFAALLLAAAAVLLRWLMTKGAQTFETL